MGREPRATVVVTTRNRRDDLRRALASAVAQGEDVELLVLDDASGDGTAEMVRSEFPQARLEVSGSPRGLIVQRNLGARLARGPVLFSLADDAEFTSPDTIARTLRDFDDPRIAVVAIPYVDVRRGAEVLQRAPRAAGTWVDWTFVGTAHALRREVFLAAGGYREALRRQGEEPDLAARLLDRGYVTRLGGAAPIHHHESPQRDARRWHVDGARNAILWAWWNAPAPQVAAEIASSAAGSLLLGVRLGRPLDKLEGVARGLGALPRERAARRPLRRQTYRLIRRLQRGGPLLLDEVEDELPPLSA